MGLAAVHSAGGCFGGGEALEKNAPELFSPVMQQTTPVGAAVMQRRVYRRLD